MKNIKKIALNDLLSSTAIQSFNIYTLWYVASHMYNQLMIAILGFLEIFNILLAPLGGVLADEYSKVKIMQLSSLLRMLILLFFVISLLLTNNLFFILMIVCSCLSIIGSFYTPAIEAIIPENSVNENSLIENNSLINTVAQFSTIAASILAGLFTLLASEKLVYTIILLMMILATISILRLRDYGKKKTFKPEFNKSKFAKVLTNFVSVFKIPVVKILLPYAILLNLSFWCFWFLTPLYLTTYFPEFKIAFSVQELIIGVSSVVCGLVVGKFTQLITKFKKFYPVMLLFQTFGIVLFTLVVFLNCNLIIKIGCFCLAWVAYGVFSFVAGIVFVTTLQNEIPSEKMGTTLGLVFSLFGILAPISSVITIFFPHPSKLGMVIVSLPMLLIPIVMCFDKRVKTLIEK
ncbi:MFS transporter [Fructilactobacillus frigidiflavus]|uniref:MFS transporter n=1 Tax=Fructilactobacillus frigidiflavus TaxID=3242688 RepID=UPI003757B104